MANEFWRKGITKVLYTNAELTTNPTAAQLATGTNEVQTVTITGTPTGGTFTLSWSGQTTAGIAYNATAAAVKTALAALSNLEVTDINTAGGPFPGTPVTVTFTGSYAHTDVAQMTANSGSLTGGTTPTATPTTTTPGVTGAVDLSPQINAMDGWDTSVERIPTENLASTFTPTINGARTVGDPSITFLDQKDPSAATGASYDTIRTLLTVGNRGTIILCPYGTGVGNRVELWPVDSSGPDDMITLGNEPAKYRVSFGITALPYKSLEIQA